MKIIELEITQTYTKTIRTTFKVPVSYNGDDVSNFVNQTNLLDSKILTKQECDVPLEAIGEPVIYYKDNSAKTGGYIKLKNKDENIRK